MAMVFFAAAMAFVLGLFAIRQLRRSVQDEASFEDGKSSIESFPLHAYHAVIQQLKQQKHELQAVQQAERRRSKASENINAAVLANLSSGVLFFNSSGLVRQANTAAKEILGFASPAGMNAMELFRNATVRGGLNSEGTPLANAITTSLKTLAKFQKLEADYTTPAGQEKVLEITISPVYDANAEILGATCLLNDCTEVSRMRLSHGLRGEWSPELLLEWKSSLQAIAASARNLAANRDPAITENLAAEISAEAERLQQAIASLSGAGTAVGAASGLN
jgi:PAS domain-containing protein